MRSTLKGGLLVLLLLYGLLLAAAVKLDWRAHLRPERLMQHWVRVLLKLLGIRVSVSGTPVASGRMTVANHVSWLDIPLIGACEPTRFVAKSEIRHWPVAGWLANAAGTFYIRRGKGGARPLLERLHPHLLSGGAVTIFPEGTTTDGASVLDFHPRLFAAAVESGCPVQPVAIRYRRTADGRDIAPFIGDDDLVTHILRILREPALQAEISYCAPITSTGLSREQLAAQAHAAIRAVIAPEPRPQRAAAPLPLDALPA